MKYVNEYIYGETTALAHYLLPIYNGKECPLTLKVP